MAIPGIVAVLIAIPIISDYAFWVVVVAYIVLAGTRRCRPIGTCRLVHIGRPLWKPGKLPVQALQVAMTRSEVELSQSLRIAMHPLSFLVIFTLIVGAGLGLFGPALVLAD